MPAFTSIQCIPNEILAEIFQHYLSQAHFGHASLLKILAQVCSNWQKVVLFSPSLWNTITLVAGKDEILPSPHSIVERIQRSGSLPLDITVVIDFYPSVPPDPMYLQVLIPFAERWRTLTLHIPFIMLEPILHHGTLYLPQMRTLSVCTTSILPSDLLCAFKNAPQLLSFTVTSHKQAPSLNAASSFTISFSTLTVLNMHVGPNGGVLCPVAFHHILSHCRRLEGCSIGLKDFDSNPSSLDWCESVGEPVVLPRLLDLSISFSGSFGSPQFLSSCILPALRNFQLHFETPASIQGRVPIPGILLGLYFKSSFSLIHFELSGTDEDFYTDELIDLLMRFRSLQSVLFMDCFIDIQDLFKALIMQSDNPSSSLLPNLSSIGIVQRRHHSIAVDHGPDDDDCIVDMIYSRLLATSTQQVFEVEVEVFGRRLREDVWERFLALQEEWKDVALLRMKTCEQD
ncbi:hypothetical protein VKT23_018594 [Stygiomarasmius scandens]|uniref:F-box domain-containing protein n=1 Tax=Marasmiellus scandens TaxID=2682957 RepID=A0ABR1IQM8_9AGAR